MSKLQNYLTEKQIIVGGGKQYGQILFLAGGAGSGKGFAASNFMIFSLESSVIVIETDPSGAVII